MDVFFVALVKPFFAVVVFFCVWVVARLLWHVIPPGRVRDVLYRPLPWYRGRRGQVVSGSAAGADRHR